MNFLADSFAETLNLIHQWEIQRQTVSTLALLLAFLFFRWGAIFTVRKWRAPSPEEKRRWIIQIKNLCLVILAAGLFGIWATELRSFALSLVAVAAAVAISTKEIIQCLMGGFWKASVRPFEVADRIEIAGFRGEVIDHNFLCTTILEIGPAREVSMLSGRQIVIPNSLFLSNPVHNQSLQQKFILHQLRLTLYAGEDWKGLETILLEAANRECASFLEGARHAMARLALREGLDLPRVEPRVTFQYDDLGRLHATLRFPTPIDKVTRTEQAILRSVMVTRTTPAILPV